MPMMRVSARTRGMVSCAAMYSFNPYIWLPSHSLLFVFKAEVKRLFSGKGHLDIYRKMSVGHAIVNFKKKKKSLLCIY